ncbi:MULTISPECIES: cytochrome P450 [unclassified Streptomyces]|uniref:cytochrome P450 n=1 Tax=unclassified Streptomyces TaxID=2593676 RepID=UPI002E15C4F3|nr:cytochrome P450 [Streptomyces sp. NBC_01296]WSW57632.1 cytochrome P450 [Streptomyces sp. NBC_00998]
MTDPTALHYPMDRQCPFAPPREVTAVRDAGEVPRVTLWNGVRPWLFTRFEDARTVLSDPRFSADKSRPGYPLSSAVALAETAVEPTLLVMDNPEHDAVRRLVLGEFTVKRAERWRPAVRAVVEDRLDRMLRGTEADLVADLALPVALTVICEFLGVPFEDRELFRSLTHTMNLVAGSTESAAAARQALQDYLEDLVAAREQRPQDDFLSRMAARHLADGSMDRRQLAAMGLLLLTAGHDTTANMISLGVLTLLRHPRHFAALGADDDPVLLAATVEEMLRHLTVVQRGIRRIAREDTEVGGHPVRAGEGVVAAINVANRDPERFSAGEEFDPAARAHGHLAFGYGPHQCMGQSLARVELQEVYAAVARRIPTLRTTVPVEEIRFKSDMAVYGVHALPVTW